MASDVTVDHFFKAANEIALHGDNDTLPFDIDNRFIADCKEDLAVIAFQLFESLDNGKTTEMLRGISIFNERLLTPSGSSGFRITTKIHPLWNIYLNGLALSIAERLEPLRSESAHSYRYSYDQDQFFKPEHSWLAYKEATLREPLLDEENSVVVQTDISGFYEHIYHHRLQNLLEDLYSPHSTVPLQIDRILNQMSSGRSFGLPVGGQCARVLAEVLMNAIDQLLTDAGVIWHRYVDDFTLVARSQSDAYQALSKLARFLSDYGLSLNRTKTTMLSSKHYKDFVAAQITTDSDDSSKLKEIDLYFDPYSDNPYEEYEQLKAVVSEIDVISLLRAETHKSQPDSYLITQISRTLEFQTPSAAASLCKTLLQPNNLNAFRASWSKIMKSICKVRANEAFTDVHQYIDAYLDEVIRECAHLLLPEANMLHFIRAIRFSKTQARARLINETYGNSDKITIKRACADCWRSWNDRPSFLTATTVYDSCSPELQRMLWLMSFKFSDEGKHFRNRVKRRTSSAWAIGHEDKHSIFLQRPSKIGRINANTKAASQRPAHSFT